MAAKTIDLKTKIPGPKSIALMERRKTAVARGPFHSTPIFAEKANGSWVLDVDGNRFLDFSCGIGVTNVGHAPNSLVNAIVRQATYFLHTSFNVVPYAGYVDLCERLNQAVAKSISSIAPHKTFLANSGAEAVENAIKIARAYTGREAVVCFDHAFHGRTYMAMSMTSKAKPYKAGFGPLAAEVYRAPFPYAYRYGFEEGASEEKVVDHCFLQFENLVNNQIGATQVAAVIIEPVLGEGGFVPAPKTFLKRLQKFCNENKIVLIADEIQSGFGRTGTLLACEQLGVTPDLVTLAKGLGGGMPISAVTGRAEIMDAPVEGGIGGTYGGNPVCVASALEVLNIMQSPDFLAHAHEVGRVILDRTKTWQRNFEVVGSARGLGPMQGIEIVKSKKTREPSREIAAKITKTCLDQGLILLTCGTHSNVIRLLVPLTISFTELDEGLLILEQAIEKA